MPGKNLVEERQSMLKSRQFPLALLLLTLVPAASALADPLPAINEILAANYSTAADPQGEYDDWIELHNAADVPIDLGGMYLTDDVENPTAWQIPAGTILGAGGYLLIWADNDLAAPGLHASFELDAAGDQIALFDVDGRTLVDALDFGRQTPDVSYGCDPDGSANWVTGCGNSRGWSTRKRSSSVRAAWTGGRRRSSCWPPPEPSGAGS